MQSYIVKAGTIIFLSSMVIWFLMNFGMYEGSFGLLDPEMDDYIQYSFMAMLGATCSAWIFMPLGFGDWQAAVTSVTGLGREGERRGDGGHLDQLGRRRRGRSLHVGLLRHHDGRILGGDYGVLRVQPAVRSVLCRHRHHSPSDGFGEMDLGDHRVPVRIRVCVGLMIYQLGIFFSTGSFTVATAFAVIVLAGMLFQIFRPMPRFEDKRQKNDRLVFAYGKEQ